MVVEEGSGAAKPAERQSLLRKGALQFTVRMCSEGMGGGAQLTVGARDCLMEYVRCILLSVCVAGYFL